MPSSSTFFQPLPPERPPSEHAWAPPVWDRPSEGTLPRLLAINAVVHENDDAVVAIESLAVYPNGFVINVNIQANPRKAEQARQIMSQPGARRIPRVGVRFADGRSAGENASDGGPLFAGRDVEKDSDGFPREVILRMVGGGGGGLGWRFGTWVYPLPPPGPVEVFVSVPQAGLEEGKAVIEGHDIRAAADHARVIWH